MAAEVAVGAVEGEGGLGVGVEEVGDVAGGVAGAFDEDGGGAGLADELLEVPGAGGAVVAQGEEGEAIGLELVEEGLEGGEWGGHGLAELVPTEAECFGMRIKLNQQIFNPGRDMTCNVSTVASGCNQIFIF